MVRRCKSTVVSGSIRATRSRRRRRAEGDGFDGLWCAETGHDPFLPLLLAAEHTERIELGTGIAVAFARNPMSTAVLANDLQAFSKGRFMLGLGLADQAAHREALLDAVVAPRSADARVHHAPCGPSGRRGTTAPSSPSGATSTRTP